MRETIQITLKKGVKMVDFLPKTNSFKTQYIDYK